MLLKLLDALAHHVQTGLLKKIGDGLPTTGEEGTRVWASCEEGNVSGKQIRPLRCKDPGQIGLLLDPYPQTIEETVAIKSISTEKVRPEAIESKWTEDILKERGLKAPIAVVKALPASQAPAN